MFEIQKQEADIHIWLLVHSLILDFFEFLYNFLWLAKLLTCGTYFWHFMIFF